MSIPIKHLNNLWSRIDVPMRFFISGPFSESLRSYCKGLHLLIFRFFLATFATFWSLNIKGSYVYCFCQCSRGYVYSTSYVKSVRKKNWQLLRLAILQPFLAIFCQLHKYFSQNLDAVSHFEGLNMSKSQLDQYLWHESQIVFDKCVF